MSAPRLSARQVAVLEVLAEAKHSLTPAEIAKAINARSNDGTSLSPVQVGAAAGKMRKLLAVTGLAPGRVYCRAITDQGRAALEAHKGSGE